jgi:hypothetical protein
MVSPTKVTSLERLGDAEYSARDLNYQKLWRRTHRYVISLISLIVLMTAGMTYALKNHQWVCILSNHSESTFLLRLVLAFWFSCGSALLITQFEKN